MRLRVERERPGGQGEAAKVEGELVRGNNESECTMTMADEGGAGMDLWSRSVTDDDEMGG
jgi:hypothetical protein